MTDLEDRLRAVTHAAAGQIADGSVPPLRAPARGRFRRRTGSLAWVSAPGRARWRQRLAPLAAAVAVLALVAGSLVIAHAAGLRPAGQRAATPTRGVQLPPYSVGLLYSATLGSGAPGDVVVRATATGRAVATVRPPHGEQFTAVSGAADGRTFVLAAESASAVHGRLKHKSHQRGPAAADGPERFYLLRLAPDGQAARPVPLGIPVSPDETDFALSPDGRQLAVSLSARHTLSVRVYDVTGGAARTRTLGTWSVSTEQHGQYYYSEVYLSGWTGSGLVSVQILRTDQSGQGMAGLLNPAGPPGQLLPRLARIAWLCSGLPSLDGTRFVSESLSHGHQPWGIHECSYSRGRTRVTVPWLPLHYRGQELLTNNVFWVSATGNTMLVSAIPYPVTATSPEYLGVLTGRSGQLQLLPGNAVTPQVTMFPGQPVAW